MLDFFIFLLYVLFLNPSAVFLHVFNSEKTRERERERQRGSESRYGTTNRRMTDINEVGGVRGVGTSRGRGSEVWLLNYAEMSEFCFSKLKRKTSVDRFSSFCAQMRPNPETPVALLRAGLLLSLFSLRACLGKMPDCLQITRWHNDSK